MTACNTPVGDRYDVLCKGEFSEVHRKLDQIDESLRGNGKPGVMVRLDRLERAAKARSKWFWIAVGSLSSVAAAGLGRLLFGG